MHSGNIGQAADTSRWSCHQTESSWIQLTSATHAIRRERGCAPYHQTSFLSRYVAAKPIGASVNKRIPGNHNAMPPLQCWAKRENEFTPTVSSFFCWHSIVQFHLFEYEMSREFVRGKSRIMTQK